jgi:hypothetical protein
LKLLEVICAHGATLAAQHDESHGSIEARYLCFRERARDFLGQAKPGNAESLAITLFHIVVDLHIAVP